MKLSEILEHIARDYLDDRTKLLDGPVDELWSPAVIVRYLNEAERLLCRRAWVLVDVGNTTVGVVPLVTAKTVYRLHASVLRVMTATPEDSEFPLHRSTDARLTLFRGEDPEYFDVNETATTAPGYPRAFATDAGTRLMRVYPAPAAAQAGLKLLLKVARLPICPLEVGKDTSPESPEEYHLDVLCKYAAGSCLKHPHAEPSMRAEGRALIEEVDEAIRAARRDRETAWMAEPAWRFCSSTAHV